MLRYIYIFCFVNILWSRWVKYQGITLKYVADNWFFPTVHYAPLFSFSINIAMKFLHCCQNNCTEDVQH
jgi:hypothetical protein